MRIPDEVESVIVVRSTKLCSLKKVLYGLEISPEKCDERFCKEAAKLVLQNDQKPCLFLYRKKGTTILIVLYDDDMLIASHDESKLNEIKTKFAGAFKIKDLEEPEVESRSVQRS